MLWNDSLAIGIPEIDNQHKELIKRINDFLEACKQQRSKEVIVAMFDFVDEYILKHFTDEQRLHNSSNYPQAARHKSIHDNFIKSFQELKQQVNEDGASLTVTIKTNKLLVDWLISHINRVDKEFAAYYKSR